MPNHLIDQIDSLRQQLIEDERNRPALIQDIILLKQAEAVAPNLGSESRHRWQWFHRESNGVEQAGAMFKKAGRVYLNIPKYIAWLTQSESSDGR